MDTSQLDPFFANEYADVITHPELLLDLCFKQDPGAQVLQQIKSTGLEVQGSGPIVGFVSVPCWAVRVRTATANLPALLQLPGLYKVALVQPAPKGAYLGKLDALVQFLSQYRENSSVLHVFVHVPQRLSLSRIDELRGWGVTIRPETWLPPVAPNSSGFYTGELIAGSVVQIAMQQDVLQVTSAEEEINPASP